MRNDTAACSGPGGAVPASQAPVDRQARSAGLVQAAVAAVAGAANDVRSQRLTTGGAVDYQVLAKWVEQALPFVALLALVFAYHFFSAIFLCVWLGCSVHKANEVIRKIVSQTACEPSELAAAVIFVAANVSLTLWLTGAQQWRALALLPPTAQLSTWQALFAVAITDSLVRCCGYFPKLLVAAATMLPRRGCAAAGPERAARRSSVDGGAARRASSPDCAGEASVAAAAAAAAAAAPAPLAAAVAAAAAPAPAALSSPLPAPLSVPLYSADSVGAASTSSASSRSSLEEFYAGLGGSGSFAGPSAAGAPYLTSSRSLDLGALAACAGACCGGALGGGAAGRARRTRSVGAPLGGLEPAPSAPAGSLSSPPPLQQQPSQPPPPGARLAPQPSGRLPLPPGAPAPPPAVAAAPHVAVVARRRARILALYESVQAGYRALLPVPIWYAYLSRATPNALLGTALSAAYLGFKAYGLLQRGQLLLLATRLVLRTGALYGRYLSRDEVAACAEPPTCPICQDECEAPIRLDCGSTHVFCETCLAEWFEREPTCPLCRAHAAPPGLRFGDGSTTLLPQLF
ncbi:RING finger and transmembrane domain-containing protein [Raphidocelis subcapitata]|uniref:RING finger and transmembrane domain-containing protein n=1 Tax=Raphidocelis subcapitata TaxID=307507 RepID=A0A2V0NR15_9CHLO|nr:RING finger and transmembrane domain-containing protein [Raphidocelis subcapitata]|eukprot:GBF89072.1 RING finger and transmembrane domain-containing protein [Raphidocelis subcapitata]